MTYRPATHFVGFRGDEFGRAQIIFGAPDFIHRNYDPRLLGDIAPGDLVIFANGSETRKQAKYSWNDSEYF